MDNYNQGVIDGIKLWGTACGTAGACDNCPIGVLRGANVTCQDFARQFPAKMASVLKEMVEGELTYYKEFLLRFPACNVPVEILAELACRRALFEGYLACDKHDCVDCWNKTYSEDVTVEPDDKPNDSLLDLDIKLP